MFSCRELSPCTTPLQFIFYCLVYVRRGGRWTRSGAGAGHAQEHQQHSQEQVCCKVHGSLIVLFSVITVWCTVWYFHNFCVHYVSVASSNTWSPFLVKVHFFFNLEVNNKHGRGYEIRIKFGFDRYRFQYMLTTFEWPEENSEFMFCKILKIS